MKAGGTLRWADLSARQGRNDLPALALTAIAERRLDIEDWTEAVADAWVMCEWPSAAAEDDVWLWAFELAGYNVDGTEEPLSTRPEKLTLYRGAIASRALGLSWTTDLKRAHWFAGRFTGLRNAESAFVYRLEATADELLAHFTRRGEDEWVVDTSDIEITDLTVIAEVTG